MKPTPTVTTLLRRLEATRHQYGPNLATDKLTLVRQLARRSLPTAVAVARFHEHLLVMRAYPDSAEVVGEIDDLLATFATRPDLRRHRAELASSGIAGTTICYRFFWPMARWAARRWPEQLHVDWDEVDERGLLRHFLAALVPYGEAASVRQADGRLREVVARLAGVTAPARFLIERIAARGASLTARESLHDAIDTPYLLTPGPTTPSRTGDRYRGAAIVHRQTPPSRERPDLRREAARPPRAVHRLSARAGAELVDLARAAMMTRARDLDAFSFGNPADVRLVADGDGLELAMIGIGPARRLLVQATYGGLTLRNGVPIGYVQLDAAGGAVELSFNTFPTFRDGEASFILGRWLAAARQQLGALSFSIEPYQLGHGNHEGIATGAWWFYRKLGFAPRSPRGLARAAAEDRRLARDRGYRSSPANLEALAEDHLFFDLDPRRPRPWVPYHRLGLAATRELTLRAGDDRELGVDRCAREARRLLGVGSWRGFTADERRWWRRLSPVILAVPGIDRWSAVERREVAAIVRAKGGRRETDYLARLDRHPRLGVALRRLAGR